MEDPSRFFRWIFKNVLDDYQLDIEFRCLHQSRDKDALWPKHFWCKSLEQVERVWPEIEDLNNMGYDIHCTIVARLRESTRKSNKEHALPERLVVTCVWADLDVGPDKPYRTMLDALNAIKALRLVPNLIVESGSGLHVYYLLAEPREVSKDRFESLLRSLANLLKGDPGAARATRLMRVPNTKNWKDMKHPRLAKARFIGKRGYRLRDLEARWKVEPVAEDAKNNENGKHDDHAPAQQGDFFDLFKPHVEKLTRSGEQATGLCPFHDDHNPSFSLNVRSGLWVCFACGRDGNWHTFRRERGISIVEPIDTDHVSSDLTWDNLPRFDPTAAFKTKWLAHLFIADGSISLAYGPRGSFKSTFFLAMAKAVAKGEEFLGMATRRRRVLYLDYENPPNVIKSRDKDLRLHLPKNRRLVIWDRFGDKLPPRPGDRQLERFVKHCIKKLHRKPWIILDSWSSLLRPGEGGETTGHIAPIYAHIRRLCDLGATVTILDHTRKYTPDIIYGGQDKEAKADTIHNFVLHENRVHPENPILRVESWLKRYAPQGIGSLTVEVQSSKDENGEWHIKGFELSARDPVSDEKIKQRDVLRKLIRKNPNMSQRKLAMLAAANGLGRDKAERMLKEGIGKYWAVSEDDRGKMTYKLLDDEEDG